VADIVPLEAENEFLFIMECTKCAAAIVRHRVLNVAAVRSPILAEHIGFASVPSQRGWSPNDSGESVTPFLTGDWRRRSLAAEDGKSRPTKRQRDR
jgi:hypothetical protein